MKILMHGLFVFVFGFCQLGSANNSFQSDSILARKLKFEGTKEGKAGDFEKAEHLLLKSIEIGKRIYSDIDKSLILPYLNLGIQQKSLGKYDEAIKSYFNAEKIIKNVYGQKSPRLGFVYGNLGVIYRQKGDYLTALEYQKSTQRVFLNDSVKYAGRIKETEFNIANILVSLNRIDEAIGICKSNISNGVKELEPYYLDLLASIYSGLKDEKLANEFYRQSISSWKTNYGDDYYSLGESYRNYADFLISQRKYEDVLHYNNLAEGIIENSFGEKSVEYSEVLMTYGDYYFNSDSEATSIEDFRKKKKQNLKIALKYYQKAAVAVTDTFTNTDYFTLPSLDNTISDVQMLTVLKKKAKAFMTYADIAQSEMGYDQSLAYNMMALNTITACTNLIHRLRIGYLSEESKFILAENQESTFMDAISIAYRLYKYTGESQYLRLAFEFTEKSKSASFLASVKDMEAKQFGGIPDSLLAKEEYLKINIANYKQMLFQENQKESPDSQKTNLYNSKIFKHNEDYNELISLLENKYPKYYSFKYENKVIQIDEIQRNLSEKEAIVEYVVNEPADTIRDGQLYRFIITKDNVDLTLETIDYKYVQKIEYLHGFLSSSEYLFTRMDDYMKYCTSANELYNILLEPVSGIISGKHLTIIPDDKLSYLPFDALISAMPEDTTKMNFRTLPYLVYDYSINYSYSSTLLFNYFENTESVSKSLLAFAPRYDYPEDTEITESQEKDVLLPLPGAKKEVELLKNFAPSDVYLDSLALESKFKELASDYDILHLAMHTIVNDSLPMFSKLAFTKPGTGSIDDGWLNTHEIYNLKLNARMAVLSACNTGSGKLQKGEGVMSLARGFLYAGCPSIIMTLWEVEDMSGTEIMRNFYKLLSKGKDKDEALRLAKLNHIKHADPLKAHPHYWLGYVNIGNSDRLYGSKDIYFIAVLLFAMIIIIIDQIQRSRKKRSGFRKRA